MRFIRWIKAWWVYLKYHNMIATKLRVDYEDGKIRYFTLEEAESFNEFPNTLNAAQPHEKPLATFDI